MKSSTYFTTSWDDGHPLDMQVADLLSKYNLAGTFYIPMEAETGVMPRAQIRDLSSRFEIGAHTMHHVDLIRVSEAAARREIIESKAWIEDITGHPCATFCFPRGRYREDHLPFIREAGYVAARTVELMNIDFPRPTKAGVLLMSTTVQAHPHTRLTYVKNTVKRAAYSGLWRYIIHGGPTDWLQLAESLLASVLQRGGVFHLWGHSWEIQEQQQWMRVEDVLRLMGQCVGQAQSVSNAELCRAVATVSPSTGSNFS